MVTQGLLVLEDCDVTLEVVVEEVVMVVVVVVEEVVTVVKDTVILLLNATVVVGTLLAAVSVALAPVCDNVAVEDVESPFDFDKGEKEETDGADGDAV